MYNSFSDIPTVKDEFMIDKYILGLSNFITGCETPLTLAIQGDGEPEKPASCIKLKKNLKKNRQVIQKEKLKQYFLILGNIHNLIWIRI